MFFCGAAFGAVLSGIYLHARYPSPLPSPSAIERARHVGLISLKTKLGLTPGQEKVVMKILDDYGKYYQNIEDEREDVAEDGRRRILQVLTPHQRELFNKMIGQTGQ